MPPTLLGLDEEIRAVSRELSRRHVELARAARRVFRLEVWSYVGYRDLDRYLRERIGISLSTIEHHETLLRRLERLPTVLAALEDGTIGYEAALLLTRVVGPRASRAVADAWIERAAVRTVKHLREEVRAVLMATSFDPETARLPPSAEDLEAAFELQRKVQTGEVIRPLSAAGVPGPQLSVHLGAPREGGGELRDVPLHLSVDVYGQYLMMERWFQSLVGPGYSFLGFLCAALWEAWMPFLEAWNDKWLHVYRRDRCRCGNPVCECRDLTPHHKIHRSKGGGDEPENIVTACGTCHIDGIHAGRLQVEGWGEERWVIGRTPILEVRGREKIELR